MNLDSSRVPNNSREAKAIAQNLERLEWFGVVIPCTEEEILYWQQRYRQSLA